MFGMGSPKLPASAVARTTLAFTPPQGAGTGAGAQRRPGFGCPCLGRVPGFWDSGNTARASPQDHPAVARSCLPLLSSYHEPNPEAAIGFQPCTYTVAVTKTTTNDMLAAEVLFW